MASWLEQRWGEETFADDEDALPPGCVPYLPCPVDLLRQAIAATALGPDDVFVDIGAGSGRAVALIHMLTGARAIGIEIQPALVRAARARAARLGLDGVRFHEGDAACVLPTLGIGSIYFLYCPFGGERLQRVLDQLEREAKARPIQIACVQLPTLTCPWLTPVPTASVELDVYRSTAGATHLKPPRAGLR